MYRASLKKLPRTIVFIIIVNALFISFLLSSSVSVASAAEMGEVSSSSGYEFDYIDLVKEIRGYTYTTNSAGIHTPWNDYAGPIGAYSSPITDYINPEYVLGGLSYDSVNDCYYVIFPEAVTIVEIIWDLTSLYNVGWDDAYLHFGLTWNGFVPNSVQGSEAFLDCVSLSTEPRDAVDFGWGTGTDSFTYTWTPTHMMNILCYRLSDNIENVPIINSGMTAFICNGTHSQNFDIDDIRSEYVTIRSWAHNRLFGVGDHYYNQTSNFYSYADAGVFTVHLQHYLASSDKYLSTVCGWNFIASDYFKLYDKQVVTVSSTDLSDIYSALTGSASNTSGILSFLQNNLTNQINGFMSQIAGQFGAYYSGFNTVLNTVNTHLGNIYNAILSIAPSPPTPSITPMPDIHAWLTPVLNDANTYKSTYSNAVDFMKEETSYLYSNYQYIRYVLYFSGMGVCMVALFFTLRKRGG